MVALATEPLALAARLGGTPVAFVTADLESHVVVLDLGGAKVIRRIRTGPGPRSIESVHDRIAVVGHTEHGVVTLLDAATNRIRAELDRFEAPRYTAVHPRRPIAYVTDSAAEAIVVVDAERGRVRRRARVPGPARHVSISPDGSTLWAVARQRRRPRRRARHERPAAAELVRTIAPPFLAHDVVFAPDGRTVWVTSGSERRIALYSRERRPRRVLEAGSPPQHVTFASRQGVRREPATTARSAATGSTATSCARRAFPSARTTSPSAGTASSRRRSAAGRSACSTATGASPRS